MQVIAGQFEIDIGHGTVNHGTGESWMWTIVRLVMVQWVMVQMSHGSGS